MEIKVVSFKKDGKFKTINVVLKDSLPVFEANGIDILIAIPKTQECHGFFAKKPASNAWRFIDSSFGFDSMEEAKGRIMEYGAYRDAEIKLTQDDVYLSFSQVKSLTKA